MGRRRNPNTDWNMDMDPLRALTEQIRLFAQERDWDQFHSPKNLSMALIAEAAELLEHFQWATEEQSYALAPQKLQEVKHEIADVFIYLVRLSDRLDIDLMDAAREKLELNRKKYPAEKVRGDARKYSDYD
jgi:NTP pyrophosphatase (non-canonical NTP hydrolase)